MKNEDMEKLSKSIQKKLGKENAGLILDDLGILLTDTKQVNEELEKKSARIEDLEKQKESLLATNSNLLKQVSLGDDEDDGSFVNPDLQKNKEDKPKTPFDFRLAFDEEGNFKTKM